MTSWFERPAEVRADVREDALSYFEEKLALVTEKLRRARSRRAVQRLNDRLARLQRGAEAAGAL